MKEKTDNKSNPVPPALQHWFTVHFAVDVLFALPLFLIPRLFLTLLGWKTVDPVSARMTAAALFGIGIESLISRKAGRRSYTTMLSLKIIWSSAAVLGLATGLLSGDFGIPLVGVLLLFVFLCFNFLWVYWFIRLGKSD